MSDFIANFHFLRPWWFVALLPALGLFVYLLSSYRRTTQWTTLIDQSLLPYLLEGELSQAKRYPIYGVLLLWTLTTLALAGPTWEQKPQPVQQNVSAMVILWDMSPSMYAQDIKPSRLVRSRLKLFDLLNARKEGLTALIVYAGDAHVVTPLTDDTATIKSLLPGLNPAMMPVAGSSPEAALELAHELLKETGISKGDIVFITDGIARDAFNRMQTLSQAVKHHYSLWGIGTATGAPIPLPSGGFAKNNRGEIVVAKVDDEQLSDAAVRMKGVYIPFANDNNDIETVLRFGLQQMDTSTQESLKLFDQWLERGHWIVLLILPLAAMAFRRGLLICLCLGGFLAPEANAVEWQDLWKTKNQQAQALLQNDNPQAAAETFQDEDWQAIANYRAGNYSAAEKQFSSGSEAAAKYNYANTLTQQGQYDKAISAYDQALELAPDFSEASDNKMIAEQLKQLQEQQQENDQQNSDQSGEEQNQENSSNQQQSENAGPQNQNDQNQSESQQNTENSKVSEQQNSEQQQNAKQQEQNLDEAQKQAMNEQYKQQPSEALSDRNNEKQQQTTQPPHKNEQNDDSAQTALEQMTEKQTEQQQALEQWLRRVPDDPSGLLRNKFKYEYQKRRRELQSRSLRKPETSQEERW